MRFLRIPLPLCFSPGKISNDSFAPFYLILNTQTMNLNILTERLPLWSAQFKSSSKLSILSRKNIETDIISRVLKDEVLKQELLKDCKSVIEKLYDIRLPQNMTIQAVEEKEELLFLVLPHNPYQDIPENELKESLGLSLENIAEWILQNQRNVGLDMENMLKIVLKAWTDLEFKEKLLKNPKRIIEDGFLTQKLPSNIIIELKEESADLIYIVIPRLDDAFSFDDHILDEDLNLNLVIGSHRFTHFVTCRRPETFSCSCPM